MPQPKVLVACPQSDAKAYCFNKWVDNVANFTYDNFAVFMADNSEKDDFSKVIASKGISVERVPPSKDKSFMQRLAESHELCRLEAIKHDFDYLLHLESDIFPPSNVIESLILCRKSVVGALYHIGIGLSSEPMVQLVEETDDEMFTSTRNLGVLLPLWLDGTVKKVYHAGLGCLLIHKSVLPHFTFRQEEGRHFHPDAYFAMDLYRKGIDIHVDTAIMCRHDNQPHSIMEYV